MKNEKRHKGIPSLYETVLLVAVLSVAAFIAVTAVLEMTGPEMPPRALSAGPVRRENPSAVFRISGDGEKEGDFIADGIYAEDGTVHYTGRFRSRNAMLGRAVLTEDENGVTVQYLTPAGKSKAYEIKFADTSVVHVS